MKTGSDVIAGLALLLFSAAGYVATTTFREVPAMLSQNVPPTFFPRLVLGAIAVLSVALVATSIGKSPESRPKIHRRVLVTAAIFIVAIVAMPRLGTLVTVALVSIGLATYWGERRKTRLAALGIALPAAIHVVFAVALGMRFPTGVLW